MITHDDVGVLIEQFPIMHLALCFLFDPKPTVLEEFYNTF